MSINRQNRKFVIKVIMELTDKITDLVVDFELGPEIKWFIHNMYADKFIGYFSSKKDAVAFILNQPGKCSKEVFTALMRTNCYERYTVYQLEPERDSPYNDWEPKPVYSIPSHFYEDAHRNSRRRRRKRLRDIQESDEELVHSGHIRRSMDTVLETERRRRISQYKKKGIDLIMDDKESFDEDLELALKLSMIEM